MNTKDLMIHVERIVRPVRADASKPRMRRELLAHLQEAFEEERARGLDEPAALAEAKRRLGDPDEITRQLQASVSRFERLSVTPFPRWVPAFGVAAAVLLPVIIAILPLPGWAAASRHARFAWAGAAGALELYVVFATVCIVKAIGIATGVTRRHWSWVVVFGLLLIPVQLLSNSLVTLALTGRWAVGALAPDALIVSGSLVALAILVSLVQTPVREWLSLDIAEFPDGNKD